MQATSVSVFCAVLSLMVLLPSGSKPESPSANASVDSSSPKFAALSDQFMKESLVLSPTNASQAGYHIHVDSKTGNKIDSELDDMSLKAMDAQREFYSGWRARFRTETPLATLGPQDAADWQLIDDQIGLNLLEFDRIQDYRHNPTVPVELIGNALFLPLTQSYAPQEARLGHAAVGETRRQRGSRRVGAESGVRPGRPTGHRLAEEFFGVAQRRSRKAPVAAHLASGQGFLRPEIPAGDGNRRHAGGAAGRCRNRAEGRAR